MDKASDDRHLLAALAKGDISALGRLYDAHATAVYHLLVARGLAPPTAEDAVQEAFLALVDRGASVVKIDNLPAYIFGIARNLAMRRLRRRRPAGNPREPSEVGSVENVTLGNAAALEALRQLPPEQAEVVALKVWHELTFAEIGEALGISLNTAASRYRYALDKLRDLWGGMDGE